jgi:hypothetical protein
MDVRSIQSSPQSLTVHTGKMKARSSGAQENQLAPADSNRQAGQVSVLSTDEQQFFEGLFPGMSKEIRGHQAYSTTGEERKSAPLGTMVDRKG